MTMPRAGGTDAAPNIIQELIASPAEQNVADLNAVVDYLAQLPECDGNIGAVGFCFGGGMALAMAGSITKLSAAVSYYGSTPEPAEALRSTNAAVLAHYSESDLKLRAFDPMSLEPLLQGTMVNNIDQILSTRHTLLTGVVIPDVMVDQLTTFMSALTDDPASYPSIVPARVPSGLPIDNP